MVERYRAGQSLDFIAFAHGTHRRRITGLLRDAGVNIKPSGWRPRDWR